MEERATGVLYLCATPIGNLEDITLRALRVLKEVDLIAAESISRTRKLLSHYDIHQTLVSYREEDRETAGRALIQKLLSGKNVALVSDAGMPGLSDPGVHLVALCRQEKVRVESVPGPTAAIMALVLSGFSTSRFVFEGFLPRRKNKRRSILEDFTQECRTIVLFESPHHLKRMLQELGECVPHRRVCVLRELTKVYEEILWGAPAELLEAYEAGASAIRGEITMVIEGMPEAGGLSDGGTTSPQDGRAAGEHLAQLLRKGYSLKDAVKEVAGRYALPRRELYEKGLQMKRGKSR
jgi:16S rRNA (cytidine1402-2'-O)-methyltransferase